METEIPRTDAIAEEPAWSGSGRARALTAALAGEAQIFLVGSPEECAELTGLHPDLYRSAPGGGNAQVSGMLLILAADGETLASAHETARAAGPLRAQVLVELGAAGGPEAAEAELAASRDRCHETGWVVAGVRRLTWQMSDAPPGAARTERLEAETAGVLLRCIRADDPRAVLLLAEAVEELERDLDVYAELAIQHARTREVERRRAQELAELEGVVGRLGGLDLAREVERLRDEVARMKATRVWRLGQAWWRLRDRLRRPSRP